MLFKSLNLLFQLFLIFHTSYGQEFEVLLNYTIKQYTKLVETVKIGYDYPTYGDPLQPNWIETHPRNAAIFEQGMFPGVLWYLYNYTGNQEWKNYATQATDGLYGTRLVNTSHDIGFVMINAYDNGYKFGHNSDYLKVIATGAETLATRFNSKFS